MPWQCAYRCAWKKGACCLACFFKKTHGFSETSMAQPLLGCDLGTAQQKGTISAQSLGCQFLVLKASKTHRQWRRMTQARIELAAIASGSCWSAYMLVPHIAVKCHEQKSKMDTAWHRLNSEWPTNHVITWHCSTLKLMGLRGDLHEFMGSLRDQSQWFNRPQHTLPNTSCTQTLPQYHPFFHQKAEGCIFWF